MDDVPYRTVHFIQYKNKLTDGISDRVNRRNFLNIIIKKCLKFSKMYFCSLKQKFILYIEFLGIKSFNALLVVPSTINDNQRTCRSIVKLSYLFILMLIYNVESLR
jgi:hypothetical protein